MKDLRDALDDVYAKRAEYDNAAVRLRDAAAKAITTIEKASHYFEAEGEKLPVTLVRELYWKALDLPVEAIARAFGVPTNQVYEVVGTHVVERTCPRCERHPVRLEVRSRSGLRGPNVSLQGDGGVVVTLKGRNAWMCDECKPVVLQEARTDRAAWERQQREQQRRDDELIAEAEAAGTVEEAIVRWAPGVGTYWEGPATT